MPLRATETSAGLFRLSTGSLSRSKLKCCILRSGQKGTIAS